MALKQEPAVEITVIGTEGQVLQTFLQVFLAQEGITPKQLSAATALTRKYNMYYQGGVREPYISQLLFSSETRKEVAQELGTTVLNLNNMFGPLSDKGVMALVGGKYIFNPAIRFREGINFKFVVDESFAERIDSKNGRDIGTDGVTSEGSSGHADVHAKGTDSGEETNIDVHSQRGMVPERGSEELDKNPTSSYQSN